MGMIFRFVWCIPCLFFLYVDCGLRIVSSPNCSLRCSYSSLQRQHWLNLILYIYWISIVFVLKPICLITPAYIRPYSICSPVSKRNILICQFGLMILTILIKIIVMLTTMIPVWSSFSFMGLRIWGKVGIGSVIETGINIKNSLFSREEIEQKWRMYILCRSLPRTSLNIIAGLPLSPLCSLKLSLLCSLPCSLVCAHLLMFAGLTGLTGLTGVTGLTGSKMNY